MLPVFVGDLVLISLYEADCLLFRRILFNEAVEPLLLGGKYSDQEEAIAVDLSQGCDFFRAL